MAIASGGTVSVITSEGRRYFYRGFNADSATLVRMRCYGSCFEPIFPANRMVSIFDRDVTPHSGERAWLRGRDGTLFEKYVVHIGACPGIAVTDQWVSVCNEGMVPLLRNGLQCVGKTVACAVLDDELPDFPPLDSPDLEEQWRNLRMAEPVIDWVLENERCWTSEHSEDLRTILCDLQRRLDDADAGAPLTSLVRWQARMLHG